MATPKSRVAGADRPTPEQTAEKDAAAASAAERAEETAAAEAAAVEGSDTTTDYARRAGGWVLTDRGWVIEDQPADAHQDDEHAEGGEQT
ncbi:hypothetical protein QRX60_16995 [Amycolatopsis mongoliensis]|uniref:Uncharacterized protein n=1 Tax=Amycolatopsis mongoliensis TaxID=715475 RepID=A0A9Y2JVF3_9PSEU|nr:hypothetical protein [Amycolatopsis sp. 4-36]WIY05456.1 hypothetical protein QRX60_16995 [Amycolatopsis sp. 4-36]